MKTRRGSSLWPTTLSGATRVNQYKPGDIVTSSLTREADFIGVVRAIDPKINKVWVAWAGGVVSQHDPDEINFEPHQSELVRSRMDSRRGRQAGKILGPGIPDGTGPMRGTGECPFDDEPKERTAQHLENVKALEPLSLRELTRAIRDAIIAEEEAIKQYETVVDSTDEVMTQGVLQDIANEERVHVGELQELLSMLLADEDAHLEEGANEVADKIDETRTASDKAAETTVPSGPQFVGDPAEHGIDKPLGGGFSMMQNLAEQQRKESLEEAEQAHGTPKTAALRSRRAMYWSNPERVYRRSRREVADDTSICPKCKKTMELQPYTKSDRMWCCPQCGFKIPGSNVIAGLKSRRQ